MPKNCQAKLHLPVHIHVSLTFSTLSFLDNGLASLQWHQITPTTRRNRFFATFTSMYIHDIFVCRMPSVFISEMFNRRVLGEIFPSATGDLFYVCMLQVFSHEYYIPRDLSTSYQFGYSLFLSLHISFPKTNAALHNNYIPDGKK